MNRIVEVRLTLFETETEPVWAVEVTKQFAPEYGGGFQTFKEVSNHPAPHIALDVARGMVTVHPARRTDL